MLDGIVELARQDYKEWKTPARRADTLDRCQSLSADWLYYSSATNLSVLVTIFNFAAILIIIQSHQRCIHPYRVFPTSGASPLKLELHANPNRIFTSFPLMS